MLTKTAEKHEKDLFRTHLINFLEELNKRESIFTQRVSHKFLIRAPKV